MFYYTNSFKPIISLRKMESREIEMMPGGYIEVRHDGKQPEKFLANELIPFGTEETLQGDFLGIFKYSIEIPERKKRETLEDQAKNYAGEMQAPFYILTETKISWFDDSPFFRKRDKRFYSEGKTQLYVLNHPHNMLEDSPI